MRLQSIDLRDTDEEKMCIWGGGNEEHQKFQMPLWWTKGKVNKNNKE